MSDLNYFNLHSCTFNMHGFNNGIAMVKQLCQDFDIIILQEHWLSKANLYKLDNIDPNYRAFGLSSMEGKLADGILSGRPFGGVAILWKQSLSHLLSIEKKDETNGKLLSVKLRGIGVQDIIISCVYFPCYKSSNDYIIELSDSIAYLENVLNAYPNAQHIIAGDLNFECSSKKCNKGFDLFNKFSTDYGLVCCDDFVVNQSIAYTYDHVGLDNQSWLDHFFITKDLKNFVLQSCVIDDGCNMSDHLPLSCVLQIPLQSNLNRNSINSDSGCRPVYKDRWDKADLIGYYFKTDRLLQSLSVPTTLLSCPIGCRCAHHLSVINAYYEELVNRLKIASSEHVPKIPVNSLKSFWNDNLNTLKQKSIDMHDLWRQIGSPKTGIINDVRIKVKLEYKLAIKQAVDSEREQGVKLEKILCHKDSSNFWKCWNKVSNKSSSNLCDNVAGHSNSKNIAQAFQAYFSGNFVNSSDDVTALREFQSLFYSLKCSKNLKIEQLPSDFVTNDCIELCISKLKCGKAAGHDGLVSEHVTNSHPIIIDHFRLLFAMFVNHAFIPEAFNMGIIVPIVKDKRGDCGSLDNYRPITLSPLISKIFESFLLEKFTNYLQPDELQFGFRKKLGCAHAIFAFRNVVEYFNDKGSNVYIGALDASKAFDRLNHYKLYSTLIDRGLPIYFIELVINWYNNLYACVRWNGVFSYSFPVKSGVRQGSILSPALFNIYVNCLITNLRSLNYGCWISNCYLGCFMYADDMILVSASVLELQKMLDTCCSIGASIGLTFNAKKSQCLMIGPNNFIKPVTLNLNGMSLPWVEKIKYLGVWICSARHFQLDFSESRRKFFVSINSIFYHSKFSSDLVKLQLFESHCLPLLTYGLGSLNIGNKQLKELGSWWNSVYRKIFGYNKWESVKEVICRLGRLDFGHLINMRHILMLKNMHSCNNSVILNLLKHSRCASEILKVEKIYNIHIAWSVAKIKAMIYNSFRSICEI